MKRMRARQCSDHGESSHPHQKSTAKCSLLSVEFVSTSSFKINKTEPILFVVQHSLNLLDTQSHCPFAMSTKSFKVREPLPAVYYYFFWLCEPVRQARRCTLPFPSSLGLPSTAVWSLD